MYKCICNNGATIGHISGCDDDDGCKACCKGKGGINEIRSGKLNPASNEGFGFSNTFDGKIRGGIKTPDGFIDQPKINNDMNKGYNVNPNRSGIKTFDNGYNVNPNRSDITPVNKKITRLHPLDIAGARRTIGQKVFDPISRKWKIDDGRPRGGTIVNGKMNWWCWGKCVVARARWLKGISCPCNKNSAKDGCECLGCAGSVSC